MLPRRFSPPVAVLFVIWAFLVLCFSPVLAQKVKSTKPAEVPKYPAKIKSGPETEKARQSSTGERFESPQKSTTSVEDGDLLGKYRGIISGNLFRPLGWVEEKPDNRFILMGTITYASSKKPVAIIGREGSSEVFFVSEGDTIGNGYKVVKISAKEVEITNDEIKDELALQLEWNPTGTKASSRVFRNGGKSSTVKSKTSKPSPAYDKGEKRSGEKPAFKRELTKREIEAWTELKSSEKWENASDEERKKMAAEMEARLKAESEKVEYQKDKGEK